MLSRHWAEAVGAVSSSMTWETTEVSLLWQSPSLLLGVPAVQDGDGDTHGRFPELKTHSWDPQGRTSEMPRELSDDLGQFPRGPDPNSQGRKCPDLFSIRCNVIDFCLNDKEKLAWNKYCFGTTKPKNKA